MRFSTPAPAFIVLGVSARVSYCQAQGCAHLYGGEWVRVRHVPQSFNAWHPATDNLAGTDVYGTEGVDDEPWSVNFSSKVPDGCPYEEFLFTSGDCTEWLVATRDAVIGEHYDDHHRPIIASSDSENGSIYQAKWYNRAWATEDPWVSIVDHFDASEQGKILYGEGTSDAHLSSLNNDGADVYVRSSCSPTPQLSPFRLRKGININSDNRELQLFGDETFAFKNNFDEKKYCMEVKDSKAENENPVQLNLCDGSSAQSWYVDSKERIRSKLGDQNYCLEGGKPSENKKYLYVWKCHDDLWQKYKFYGERIFNQEHLRYIGAKDGNGSIRLDYLEFEEYSSGDSQQLWTRKPELVAIKNNFNQKYCIAVKDSKAKNENPVWLELCNGSPAQSWFVDSKERIRSQLDQNYCLEGGKPSENKKNLYIWECHDDLWQKYTFGGGRILNREHDRYIGVKDGNGSIHQDYLEFQTFSEDTQQQWTQKQL